jgi:hypothetical protein
LRRDEVSQKCLKVYCYENSINSELSYSGKI